MPEQATKGEEKKTEGILDWVARKLFYTDNERREDLAKAGFKKEDIEFFVKMGKKHDLSENEFVLFCDYHEKGVPESDFKDFKERDVALRYGFTPTEAAKLSEAKRKLNAMPEFKGNEITIFRIVETVQTMETQGNQVRDSLKSSSISHGTRKKYERMIIVDETFRDVAARNRIMEYYKNH
jgi:hypothetical protein